jgi:hypothetical protein
LDTENRIVTSDTGELSWYFKKGLLIGCTDRTSFVSGFLSDTTYKTKTMEIMPASKFGTIVLTSLDNNPIKKAKHMLLTAVGRVENTAQKLILPSKRLWNSPFDKSVIGAKIENSKFPQDLGKPPVLIRPLDFQIKITNGSNKTPAVYPLDFKGKRRDLVPKVTKTETGFSFSAKPEFHTVYYEIVFEDKNKEKWTPEKIKGNIPLCGTTLCRQGVEVSQKKIAAAPKPHFIKNWHLLGPYRNPGNKQDGFQGLDTDYLKELGGEKKINNIPLSKWKAYKSQTDFVNLLKAFGGISGPQVAYVKKDIFMPREKTLIIAFGSDDGAKMWLNKQLIINDKQHKAATKDSEFRSVKLKKGMNSIIIKIDQSTGDWGFYFRFLSPSTMEPADIAQDI